MKISGNKKIPKSGPLLCWDVYMLQNYALTELLEEDVRYLEHLALQNNWNRRWNYHEKIVTQKQTVLVTCPQQQIVFASSSFLDMTGYLPEEVLGRSPKILQGAGSSPETSAYIGTAIAQQQSFSASLVNYKKDGSRYTCHIEGHPILNRKGELVNFIAFEHAT